MHPFLLLTDLPGLLRMSLALLLNPGLAASTYFWVLRVEWRRVSD